MEPIPTNLDFDAIEEKLREQSEQYRERHLSVKLSLYAGVRRAAEELMLCTDVDEAIARPRQDPEALLCVECLTNRGPIERNAYVSAARRAFEETIHEPTALPFHCFCSYLIELCNGLEIELPDA